MTVLLAAGSLLSGLGSVFGGSGPDAAKFAERSSRVATLYNLAKTGSYDAYLYLAAIGQIQPLPKAVTIGGLNTAPAGFTSEPWGDAYNSIVNKARTYATQLQPQFAQMGLGVTTFGGMNPVLLAGGGGGQVGATPAVSGFQKFIDSVPWYGWAALVLALLLLGWLALR